MAIKSLIINPGSTSTKLGVFEDTNLLYEETLRHTTEEIAQFDKIVDQKDFRKEMILNFLKNQNEERGLHLVAAVGVHIEPMGVYSATFKSLTELPDGASIGVPNDTDNYGRAIDLLNALGLLEGAPTDPEKINEING